MVVHTFNSSTQDTEAGECVCVPGQPGLHSKFQASQGYLVRLYLKI